MRVYTQLVYQWSENGLELQDATFYDYDGPVAQCKGGDQAKAEKDRANRIQDAELARQNDLFDMIKKSTSRYTDGDGEGYSPLQMKLLQGQFLNDNASQYQQAGAGVRSALASRGSGGGDAPVGGDYVRGISSLMSGRANNLSGGMANLKLADLQQALTNKFNSLSLQSGNAATLNSPISTLGSQSANALDAYIKAKNSGFMSNMAGGIGQGLGAGITGGIGKALKAYGIGGSN